MALQTQGFEVILSLIDNSGNKVTKTYQCNPATVTDLTTAQAARAALIAAMANVSDMELVGTRLTEIQYEDAIVYPASLVEAENKASLTCQILGQNKKANLKIPAPNPNIFVGLSGSAANQIDVTDPALIAYVALFDSTGEFLVSDGEQIDTTVNGSGIIVGKRISAKNNNG